MDPIELLPPDAIRNTEPDDMLNEMMTLADFKIPTSDIDRDDRNDPVDLIPRSIKSET